MFLNFCLNLKTDYLHPVYLWLSKHFWLRESSRLQRITWRPTCQRPWSSSCRPSKGKKERAACHTPAFWSSASSAWIGRCWISSPPTTMKQVRSAILLKIEVRLNLPFCISLYGLLFLSWCSWNTAHVIFELKYCVQVHWPELWRDMMSTHHNTPERGCCAGSSCCCCTWLPHWRWSTPLLIKRPDSSVPYLFLVALIYLVWQSQHPNLWQTSFLFSSQYLHIFPNIQ